MGRGNISPQIQDYFPFHSCPGILLYFQKLQKVPTFLAKNSDHYIRKSLGLCRNKGLQLLGVNKQVPSLTTRLSAFQGSFSQPCQDMYQDSWSTQGTWPARRGCLTWSPSQGLMTAEYRTTRDSSHTSFLLLSAR